MTDLGLVDNNNKVSAFVFLCSTAEVFCSVVFFDAVVFFISP